MSLWRVMVVLCAVSILASRATASPIAGAPPVEVFAAPPFLEGPKISPDGTRLVAKMLVRGEQMLVVHSSSPVAPRCTPILATIMSLIRGAGSTMTGCYSASAARTSFMGPTSMLPD